MSERVNTPGTVERGLEIIKDDLKLDIPEGKRVTGIMIERFQSDSFYRALSFERGRENEEDGQIVIVSFEDNTQTIFVRGKSTEGNPFALWVGGVDLRRYVVTRYEWDGNKTLTEYSQNGEFVKYSGEYGVPTALLPLARERLGRNLKTETFA